MPRAMANETRITEIVGQEAYEQLKKLNASLVETKTTYSELAREIANTTNVKPKSYEELDAKMKSYDETMRKMMSTQNELAKQQKEYNSLLKKSLDVINEKTSQIVEEAKANDLNASAELKATKAETERLRQQKLLNQESKKRVVTEEEVKNILDTQVKSIAQAQEQNNRLRLAVKQVSDEDVDAAKKRELYNKRIDENTKYIKQNTDSYTRQKMTIGDYANQIREAFRSQKTLSGAIKESIQIIKGQKSAIVAAISVFIAYKAAMFAFNQFKKFVVDAVNTIKDFEKANSVLASILGTTRNEIKELTSDARRLGATTAATASQVTQLQTELAKLGFSREEILASTEAVLQFALATGADLPDAAALAGAALRIFDADASEMERYVSSMAIATNKSALSFSKLATAIPIVAPVAKSFGFEIEDVLALLGKLSDAGFDASMSATALRNIFLNLADSGGKLVKEIGKPVKSLEELRTALIKLEEKGIDLGKALDITDKRSVSQFLVIMKNANALKDLKESITDVSDEMKNAAEERVNNLSGSLTKLSSAWEGLMLTFSESSGTMKTVVDFFTNLVISINQFAETAKDLADKSISTAASNATGDYMKEANEMLNQERQKLIDEGMSKDEAEINSRKNVSEKVKAELDNQSKAFENYYSKISELQNRYNYLNNLAPISDIGTVIKEGWFTGVNKQRKELEAQIEVYGRLAAKSKYLVTLGKGILSYIKKEDREYTELTEAQKKAAEKAAKERLKIQQNLEQSRLDLMDEGLDKELAKISLGFAKRIAAIRGNSKEEQETRENLTKQMQDSLNKYELNYYVNVKKEDLNNRLDTVEKGSQEELDLRLELLKYQQWQEEDMAEKTGASLVEIDKKYKKKRKDIIKDFDLKGIEAQYSKELSLLETNAIKEENVLTEKRNKGEISERDYQIGLFETKKKYAKLSLELAIKQAKLELEASRGKVSDADFERMQNEIDKLEAQLKSLDLDPFDEGTKQWSDSFIEALDNMNSAAEDALGEMNGIFRGITNIISDFAKRKGEMGKDFSFGDFWKELDPTDKAAYILQAYSELFNGITAIMNNIYDSRIEKIEEEQEANEEAGEKELERLDKLAESGAISEEEAESQKRAAKKKTEEQNEELEKRKAELKLKQARWDKANSITQAIISTSLAVITAYKMLGPIAGAVFAAIIAGIGAAQVAMIAAQPIPKYAKGTDSHPGGLAVVGDGGKREAVLFDSSMYITPAIPTVVELPKGAKVISELPAVNDMEYLRRVYRSDLRMNQINNELNGYADPVINNHIYMDSLDRKMDELIQCNQATASEFKKIRREISKNSYIASRGL